MPECDVPVCTVGARRAPAGRFTSLGAASDARELGLALGGDGAALRFYGVSAQHGW